MFENHRKSLIQHCERSELHLHFHQKCPKWSIWQFRSNSVTRQDKNWWKVPKKISKLFIFAIFIAISFKFFFRIFSDFFSFFLCFFFCHNFSTKFFFTIFCQNFSSKCFFSFQVEAVFKQNDNNQDGKLTLEEFQEFMQHHKKEKS